MALVDLGRLGQALTVAPTGSSGPRPHPILVLDVSGSMGQDAPRIANHVVPDALERLGYKSDDCVSVVLFHSHAERATVAGHDPTVGQLRGINARARGTTFMAGVFSHLTRAVAGLPEDRAAVIIGLSDGAISDPAETLVQSAATRLGDRTVSVALIRWDPAGRGHADTRALASLGVLSTAGAVPLHDSRTTEQLTDQLVECLDVAGSVELVADAPVLRRTPGSSPTDRLILPAGQTSTVLVDRPADMTLDGRPVEPTVEPLTGEHQLRRLIEYLGEQLKMRLVVGNAASMDRDLDWLLRLDVAIKTLATSDEADDDVHAVSTRSRVERLQRTIRRRSQGLLTRVLQMRNRSDVARLNSTQQASFLQGGLREDSAAARRLARRTDDADPDEQARDAAGRLAQPGLAVGAAAEAGPAGDGATSFYSLEGPREALESAAALATTDVTAAELMTVVGGLGVAIESVVEPLPDPWAVRIVRVYLSGLRLSEQDRCQATGDDQTGETRDLHFPGLDRPARVTGVVPLRSDDPAFYDVYHTELSALARMHASASLRGLVAPVPHDQLALQSAAAVAASRQISGRGSELERRLVADLWDQARPGLARLKDVVEGLAGADPRAWMTGDRGISGPLKPLAVLAVRPAAEPAAVRAVFGLEVLARFRRRDAEPDELARLLGQTLETELAPLFEPDPPLSGNVTVDWPAVEARAGALAWAVDARDVTVVLARAGNSGDLQDTDVADDALGMDPATLMARVAVDLVARPGESDRIDRDQRRCHAPDYGDGPAWDRHIAELAAALHRERRRQLEAQKLKAEDAEMLRRRVVLALATDSRAQFLEQLAHIPSRSSPGYAELEAGVIDLEATVPDRQLKIEVLVLGRTRDDQPVWARGASLVAPEARFQALSQAYMAGGPLHWAEVARRRRLHMRHQYRETGGANRHGHSNDRPSYFGHGYATLELYLDSVDPKTRQAYLVEHAACCGVPDYCLRASELFPCQ